MANIFKAALYAGIGVADKVKEEVTDLVKRGELKQQDAQEMLEAVKEREQKRVRDIQDRVEAAVRAAVDRLPKFASRAQVEYLEQRVHDLEAQLRLLQPGTPEKEEANSAG